MKIINLNRDFETFFKVQLIILDHKIQIIT